MDALDHGLIAKQLKGTLGDPYNWTTMGEGGTAARRRSECRPSQAGRPSRPFVPPTLPRPAAIDE